MNAFHRGRRLRWTPELRTLVRETPPLLSEDLIMPYFVVETADAGLRKEIPSMPGQYQLSLQELEKQVGCRYRPTAVILFGIPAVKDEQASGAYAEKQTVMQQAVRLLKQRWPKLLVITDVCLCEYMSHGHCGVLMPDGAVSLNDATLPLLAKTAVSHAEAGADMVAPSDMMDGRVAAIREALDQGGLTETPVLSYAVKYASAYYGPFRDAAESALTRPASPTRWTRPTPARPSLKPWPTWKKARTP